MIMDELFNTQEEAKQMNLKNKNVWKYFGIAENKEGFTAWRTNSKTDLINLIEHKGDFKEFKNIQINS